MEFHHWPWGVFRHGTPVHVAARYYEMFLILSLVNKTFFASNRRSGLYLLSSVFVQDPIMFGDLNLPLGCQVLVSEEDNTTLID